MGASAEPVRERSAFAVQIARLEGKEPIPLGSGFVVGPRHVLTCRHVTLDQNGVRRGGLCVRLGPEEKPISVEKVTADPGDADVAVLEVGRDLNAAVATLASRPISPDERFECWGYPKVDHEHPSVELEQVAGSARRADQDDRTLNLGLDADCPAEWSGMSGAAVQIRRRVVGVVRGERQSWGGRRLTATPASAFCREGWFLEALGHTPVRQKLEGEARAVRDRVAALLAGHHALRTALAYELDLEDSDAEVLSEAVFDTQALPLVQALDGADAVLAQRDGTGDQRRALRQVLDLVLPFAIDWRATIVQARLDSLAGVNAFELEYWHETIAEAVLAGVDGRCCAFVPLDRGARLGGVGFVSMPGASLAPILRSKEALREAVLQKLSSELGLRAEKVVTRLAAEFDVPGTDTGMLAGAVEGRLRTDAGGRGKDKIGAVRRSLLVVDADFAGPDGGTIAWEVVTDAVAAVLPSLRLVRLTGAGREQSDRETSLATHVERIHRKEDPS